MAMAAEPGLLDEPRPGGSRSWRDLVSPRVGVVRAVRPQPRGHDEPQPPYLYTAELSNFDYRVAERSERMGAGKGFTEEAARAAAVGEAVERYCAYHWDPRRCRHAPVAEVGMDAITPADCVLFAAEQYARHDWPHPPWHEEQPITWMTATGLPGGEPVAVPAGMTYLTHPQPDPAEHFAPVTSNGLAAGSTVEAAALGGLCELIERDALMIAWMNRLAAVELELRSAAGLPGALHRHYAALGVDVRAFVLPTDLPATVVLAMSVEDRPGVPAAVVGMGCHPAPMTALTKALFELCQGRPAEAGRYRESPPEGRLERPEDVVTLDDHSAFATIALRRGEFQFLESGGAMAVAELDPCPEAPAAEDLERCTAALRDLGHRAAYVDLTLPDVASCGYHVVRVFAAGLQPIHFGHGQERLGGTRLFSVPQRLGLRGAPSEPSDLNPSPHPLA
jgi:ribosomal protein S12 methylthiotransferase accessory factor